MGGGASKSRSQQTYTKTEFTPEIVLDSNQSSFKEIEENNLFARESSKSNTSQKINFDEYFDDENIMALNKAIEDGNWEEILTAFTTIDLSSKSINDIFLPTDLCLSHDYDLASSQKKIYILQRRIVESLENDVSILGLQKDTLDLLTVSPLFKVVLMKSMSESYDPDDRIIKEMISIFDESGQTFNSQLGINILHFCTLLGDLRSYKAISKHSQNLPAFLKETTQNNIMPILIYDENAYSLKGPYIEIESTCEKIITTFRTFAQNIKAQKTDPDFFTSNPEDIDIISSNGNRFGKNKEKISSALDSIKLGNIEESQIRKLLLEYEQLIKHIKEKPNLAPIEPETQNSEVLNGKVSVRSAIRVTETNEIGIRK